MGLYGKQISHELSNSGVNGFKYGGMRSKIMYSLMVFRQINHIFPLSNCVQEPEVVIDLRYGLWTLWYRRFKTCEGVGLNYYFLTTYAYS